MTAEEQRAMNWCKAREARKAWHEANCARLAGNPSARKQLELNWKPILSYVRERLYGTQES